MESKQNEAMPSNAPIVDVFRLLNDTPSHEQWVALWAYAHEAMPAFVAFLERKEARLHEVEKDVCLLLRLNVPIKQIVKLTNVSFQNLNLMRKRMLKKLYGMEGSGRDFDAKIRVQG